MDSLARTISTGGKQHLHKVSTRAYSIAFVGKGRLEVSEKLGSPHGRI